jgi:glucuronate isomerase
LLPEEIACYIAELVEDHYCVVVTYSQGILHVLNVGGPEDREIFSCVLEGHTLLYVVNQMRIWVELEVPGFEDYIDIKML